MTGRAGVRIGTAGWSIPKPHAALFPAAGTHLQRYAQCFNAVEINSSFYGPHKPTTYASWAAAVPPGFRFAVKLPREITHTRRLTNVQDPLERFLQEIQALGEALGPLLVQLPPSLRFDSAVAGGFFDLLRGRFSGHVVCEPRHATWFTPEVDTMLAQYHIARAMADPAPVPSAAEPGGYAGITYRRLHGSPRTYYSAYTPEYLTATAAQIKDSPAPGHEHWCIFDNTADGHATHDALALAERLQPSG